MAQYTLCVYILVIILCFQVQAVTNVGAGNFSVPILVQRSTDDKSNSTEPDVITPKKDVLVVLFPSLAIIVVTLTAVFVVLYCLR